MGYFEYFIYSKMENAPLEGLADVFLRNSDVIDLLCATEAKTDIFSDRIQMFGREAETSPIEIAKGTKGLIIGTEIHHIGNIFSTLEKIRFQPEIKCLDHIVLSANKENQNKNYEDFFFDSPIEIHGTKYFAVLKEEEASQEKFNDSEIKHKKANRKKDRKGKRKKGKAYGKENTKRKSAGINRTTGTGR